MLDKKPRTLHTVLESRVAFEALAHFSSKPLHRFLPQGDGHPVLVIPAFLTSDAFTATLRGSLTKLGYDPHPWGLGLNTGLHQSKLERLQKRLKEIVLQRQQKITIIGWSLGGLYARALANMNSEHVRQVITLGSPFGIPTVESEGVQSAVGRIFMLLNSGGTDPMMDKPELWQNTPSVPFTGIYTESDGVVHWHYCLDEKQERSENIRVPGSHVGLTHNPAVLYLLADRLKVRPESWTAFNSIGWRERLFDNRACSKVIELAEEAVEQSRTTTEAVPA